MRSTVRYIFDEVKLRGSKRVKCSCGKTVARSKTFSQTLNPYNKSVKGELKTRADINLELQAERDKWLSLPVECDHFLKVEKK